MIRLPAVAGQFYSASAEQLRADVRGCIPLDAAPEPAVAAVAPHAGLRYSGSVAAEVYSRLALPATVILIGPNHTGLGPPVSVFPEGRWVIPGADIPIDHELSARLLARCPAAQPDATAHRLEHCLELHLPFVVHAAGRLPGVTSLRIVPVVLGTIDLGLCEELGVALAEVIVEWTAAGRGTPFLAASTDMNHYEPEEVARRKDALAIEAMERLDARALHERATTHHSSMCGLGPAVTTLTAARRLAARRARLARYTTSAEASGDRSRVVGYAGLIIS